MPPEVGHAEGAADGRIGRRSGTRSRDAEFRQCREEFAFGLQSA
jgi:hypothetical protein